MAMNMLFTTSSHKLGGTKRKGTEIKDAREIVGDHLIK